MNTPTITGATGTVSKALNWKTVLFTVVLTIIVTIIVSRLMKQSIVLYDQSGNVSGEGEIKNLFRYNLKKQS